MKSNIRKSLRHSDPTQHVRMRQRSVDDVKFYILTLISFNNIHIFCLALCQKTKVSLLEIHLEIFVDSIIFTNMKTMSLHIH